MLRSIVKKVMWVGRATVFMVGLAVILAMLFGAASMAFAANGDPWRLGQNNAATAITSLGGRLGVDGPMLRITNNNGGTNDTALELRVESGEPPMTVNSDSTVANLNADKVDGQEVSAFVHTTSSANNDLDCTIIDNPAVNGKPNAKLVVTHRFSSFTGHNKTVGVDYDSTSQKWAICNEDVSDMPNGLLFHVIAVV